MSFLLSRLSTALLALCVVPLSFSAVRLGIITTDREADLHAELLTAELSKRATAADARSPFAGMELVERTELQRIVGEQKLASTSTDNVVRAGGLIGADGLIALDLERRGTNQHLSVELIAVRNGIALGIRKFPSPIPDPEAWARVAANEIAPLLPKLGVNAAEALKISVLNLRSATASRSAEQLDRELTGLLLERLVREKEVFVLERRKLEPAAFEKELNRQTNAFWNGSYLLDGTINKQGYSPNVVTISGQITGPDGKQAESFEVSGNRTNLAEVVDRFAGTVLSKLNRKSTASWSPLEEGRAFLDEARWCLKWGMVNEAQAAAEAAWALGLQTRESANLRIGGYRDGAKIFHEIRRTDVYGFLHYDQPADPKTIDDALRALEVYLEYNQRFSTAEKRYDAAWHKLGLEVLERSAQVLQNYYIAVETRAGHETELAELRGRTRELAAELEQFSPERKYFYSEGGPYGADEILQALSERSNIFQLISRYAALWVERPEEAVKVYRELLKAPGYALLRNRFMYREGDEPILCGWTWNERKSTEKRWGNLVDEVCSSTNAVIRIEGLILRAALARTDEQVNQSFGELLGEIERDRIVIIRQSVPLRYDLDLEKMIGSPSGVVSEAREKWSEKWRSQYSWIEKMDDEHREWEKANRAFEDARKFFSDFQRYDFTRVADLSHTHFSVAQAQTMVTLLQNYRSNLVATGGNLNRGEFMGATNFLGVVEKELKKQTGGAASEAPKMQAAISRPPPTAVRTNKVSSVALDGDAGTIEVNKFWQAPQQVVSPPGRDGRAMTEVYREGQLWIAWIFYQGVLSSDGPQAGMGVQIIAVDPLNERFQVIDGPNSSSLEGMPWFGEARPILEVLNGKVYLARKEGIRAYDLGRKTWSALSIDAPDAELYAINQQLYATTRDSILKLDQATGGAALLASTRRRPPAGELDQLNTLNYPKLFAGPEQTLRTFVTNSIYSWNGQKWDRTWQFPRRVAPAFSDETAVFMEMEPYQKGLMYALAPHAIKPEVVAATPTMYRRGLESLPTGVTNNVIWKTSPKYGALSKGFVPLGDNYLSYGEYLDYSPSGANPPVEKDGRHANLLYFDRRVNEPAIIPLRFDLSRGPLPNVKALKKPGFSQARLILTPAGLLILHEGIPGYWIIPRQELEGAMRTAVNQKLGGKN